MMPMAKAFQQDLAHRKGCGKSDFDLRTSAVNLGSTALLRPFASRPMDCRFPSPVGRIGLPLGRPPVFLFARQRFSAVCSRFSKNALPDGTIVAKSRSITRTTRGKETCVFQNGSGSASSPSRWPLAATLRLNKGFWARAQVSRQPLSSTPTPLQQPLLAPLPTLLTARCIRHAAKAPLKGTFRAVSAFAPTEIKATRADSAGGLRVVMPMGSTPGPRTGRDWECSKRS